MLGSAARLPQVDVQLEFPARVSLMPSLDDIQECINKSAQAILGCFKQVKTLISSGMPASDEQYFVELHYDPAVQAETRR